VTRKRFLSEKPSSRHLKRNNVSFGGTLELGDLNRGEVHHSLADVLSRIVKVQHLVGSVAEHVMKGGGT